MGCLWFVIGPWCQFLCNINQNRFVFTKLRYHWQVRIITIKWRRHWVLSIICAHIVITLIEICIIYISLPGHLGELVKWSEQITSLAHMRHGGLCVLTLTVRTQVRKTWWNTFYIRGDITLKCTAESNEIFSVPKAWLCEWHQWGIVSH